MPEAYSWRGRPTAYPPGAMRLLVPLVLAVAIAAAVVVLSAGTGGDGKPAKSAASSTTGDQQKSQTAPKRGPKIVSGPHDSPVPILMYHVVSAPQPGAPYPDLYTPK